MAKATCTVTFAVEGNDIIVRFVNGRTAQAAAPTLNADGRPKKKGMVGHSGGYQLVDDQGNYISAMLMRKV